MNTYEKVVEYLNMYKNLEYDIEFYMNKMTGLKAVSYSQEEKGTSRNEDMMVIYMQKIEEATEKQREIEKFIEKNFNSLDRLIIHDKFISGMTLQQIGNEIGYSSSHCKKLINKAIYRYLAK